VGKTLQTFRLNGVYLDLGVLKPRKIAIELDHSERGSGLRWLSLKHLSTFLAVLGNAVLYYSTMRMESCLWTERKRQKYARFMRSNFTHESFCSLKNLKLYEASKERNESKITVK